MPMIKYTSQQQISIEDFIHPFGGQLSADNRWVKLALLLPWDEMVAIYVKKMSVDQGRPSVDPRTAIGALIIKHLKGLTDEDTVEEIRENPYLQYFLGCKSYSYKQPFTASLFVSFRKRLGAAEFELLNDQIISVVDRKSKKEKRTVKEDQKDDDSQPPNAGSSNKGHLIVDATVAPADIKYPTDLDLLGNVRKISEHLIDNLHAIRGGERKPRTYRQKAQKEYLALSKKRKKSKKALRKIIGGQLRYIRRNLKHINNMLDETPGNAFPLPYKRQRLLWIIQEIYRQQKEMHDSRIHKTPDRIVSISQPHVRPIVRGKAGREVEFGAKLSLSLVDGCCDIHRIGWDSYNESTDLITQIDKYREKHGHYPEHVSGDQIYGTRDNRTYMKKKGVKYTGVPLGRRAKADPAQKALVRERKAQGRKRVEVEGKFGEGKRKYDWDRVKAKRADTSESWIACIALVMNIAHLLRVIFLSLLKTVKTQLRKLKNTFLNDLNSLNPFPNKDFGFSF